MEEQLVELGDYLRVIWRRKWVIIGGTLLAVIVALAVTLLLPKTYEVSRTLKIGHLQERPIETREAVIDRLTDQRLLPALVGASGIRIVIDRTANPNVRYTVQASDPALATRVANSLAEKIIAMHEEIFSIWANRRKRHQVELEAAARSIEAEIIDMKKVLAKITESPKYDGLAVVLLQGNVGERERSVASMRRELIEIRESLVPPESQNTIVIAAEGPPERPSKPKVKLNVALAGGLGLMMFTFLAFLLEYLGGGRSADHGNA